MELIFNKVGGGYGIVATVELPDDPAEHKEFVAAMQAMVRELNVGLQAWPQSRHIVLTWY